MHTSLVYCACIILKNADSVDISLITREIIVVNMQQDLDTVVEI